MFEPIRRKDNSLLGENELTGVPEGRNNATPEQVKTWLDRRFETADNSTGKVFRNINSHFLLDWNDPDIPNPAFQRREKDLSLIMFPEVASPYKFPEYIYQYDDLIRIINWGSGLIILPQETQVTIKPPLYDDELNLSNPDVEIRIIKDGYNSIVPTASGTVKPSGIFIGEGEFGVRVYTTYSASGIIPVKAKRPGNIYNKPAGQILHCAPHHWLAEDNQNSVYGKDYLTSGGSGYTIGGSEVGPPIASGRLEATASGGMNSTYFDAMQLGPNQVMFDDDFWEWYKWEDGADEYRKFFFNKIQAQYIPQDEAYGMLLHDVIGMSQGGNNDRSWIDPIYYDQIAPTMQHKMFRDISHCYKVDKCNFAETENNSGEVFLIEDVGFKKDEYAQISDDDKYCRYRQSEANAGRKSNLKIGNDWDRFCKYLGVPQRAVEFDGNYKELIKDILQNFRIYGIYYWSGFYGEEESCKQEQVSNGFKLTSTRQLSTLNNKNIFGQMNAELGTQSTSEQKEIPADTILFFYKNIAPDTKPVSYKDISEQYNLHRKSKVFAYIWQYTHIGKEKWLVELKDDYISPIYRISEFEVSSEITNGENPFVKDKKFTGKNAGGLRFQLVKNKDSGVWRVEYPYDINPEGFYNLEGGNVQLTGLTDDSTSFYWPNAKLPPVFVDIPSCLARGTVRAIGLPGEIIEKNSIFWKSPTIIKWDHILELHDKLINPTTTAPGYENQMSPIEVDEQQAKDQFGYKDKKLTPGLKGLTHKPEPNHILVGTTQDNEMGTGMVSNGDTPFSDIILLSDMLHTRNMVLPMIPYKLTPYTPDGNAEWFEDQVQDFATRQSEPHHLTVKRMGYKEPGIYCFMTNNYKGEKIEEDVSYTMMVPTTQDPFIPHAEQEGLSEGGRNKIYRIYHPNGMKWWKDNGLLGCGIQYGKVADGSNGYYELGAKGGGLTQVGTAVVNFFRQNLPLDKEVVACYLRLVPSNTHAIGSSVVKTAGGGRQWINGNNPFHNMTFNDPNYNNYFKSISGLESYGNVDYEMRLLWDEEHQHDGAAGDYPFNEMRAFCKSLKFTQELCGGPETFHYKGDTAGKVSRPGGGNDSLWGIYHKNDFEKTKKGNFLDDIEVTVKAGADVLTFKTGQRSSDWYENIMTDFMTGAHSKTDPRSLCTRLDYDEDGDVESGNDSKGMGFACSSGGWAKDHRVFDITNIARKAYVGDRFTAKYDAIVDLKLSEMGEPYNLILLKPIPNSEYISLGEVALSDRVVKSSEDLLYETLIENKTEWGTEGNINYGVFNLKQIPPPRVVEGVTIIDDPTTVPSSRKLRENCIISGFKISGKGHLGKNISPILTVLARPKIEKAGDANGWRLIKSETKEASVEDTGVDHSLDISYDLIHPSQFKEVMIMSNLKLKDFQVLGWTTENWPSQCPMTNPPNYETHMFNKIIVDKIINKHEGDYAFAFLNLPATKIYEVLVAPMLPENFANALPNFKDGVSSIPLSYKGIFNPYDPPKYIWEVLEEDTENERWFISEGEYCYSSSMNAVILPTIYKYKEKLDPENANKKINIKVGSLENLGATISYVTGRGAKSLIKIKASASGPAYDVDSDTIIEVTDSGGAQLGTPIGEFYGDDYLPWSCTNPNELKGGYLQGETPDNSNPPLENYFTPQNGVKTTAWDSYCSGLLEVFGEPDMLINSGEFQAPAYIEDTDPVTGEKRVNNLKFESGIDSYKVPNGGRLPLSLTINLSTSGSTELYNEEDEYRKQQVGFVPEIYVYLRERIGDNYSDKSSTWSLNLG